MTMLVRVAIAALLALGFTVPTLAAESTFPDIQRILDESKLRVAILARDAPPMIMTGEKGAPIGFGVDHAIDISKKMGVAVEFVRTAETYNGVIDLVARKEADIAVYLSSGVRRAMKVHFSKPYITEGHQVFYNRASFARLRSELSISTIQQLATTEAAKTLEFGVLAGSIYQETLEQDLPQFPVRPFNSLPEMINAVRGGQVFAGLHGELELEFYIRQNPGTAIHIGITTEVRRDDIRIAVRPDAPNLLHWVNVYLDKYVGLLDTAAVIGRFQEGRGESE